MGQKSGPVKEPAEQVVRESAAQPGGNFPRRRRLASFCPVCAARTVSSNRAAARGSSRTSITASRRNFSRPARGAWRATLRGRQPRARSRSCAGRPARSRRWWPS